MGRDKVIWSATKTGEYSVRDGNRFWNDQYLTTTQVPRSMGWNTIWKLTVPHKIRVFLWILGCNNLPLRSALIRKGIMLDNVCPFCRTVGESVKHIFVQCEFAKSCWQEVVYQVLIQESRIIGTWILDTLGNEKREVLLKVVSVLWGIWFFRNKLVWDDKVVIAKVAIDWSSKMISDWQTVRAKPRARDNGTGNVTGNTQMLKWQPPGQGKLKLNVDASVLENEHFYSVGMVLRDHLGTYITGNTLNFAGRVSAFEAEVVGVAETISWIDSLIIDDVIVESDSSLTVFAINSSKTILLEVGDVIDNCRDKLRFRRDISLVHARKQTNKGAHLLACCPCIIGCSIVFTSPPDERSSVRDYYV